MTAEDGLTSLKGCVIGCDPTQRHWRKVTFFSETVCMADEKLMRAEDRLRSDQATDTYETLGAQKAKEHPVAF